MRIIVVFVIVLWLAWYFTGGPSKYEQGQGPYITAPAPVGTGETYWIEN